MESRKIESQELTLSDLIDKTQLQDLMNKFFDLTGLGSAVEDNKGNILVATGWQDICTKFHRINPETCLKCKESDEFFLKTENSTEFVEYKCRNGMWDISYPIVIDGKIMGGVYFGQFFYDDEKIDYDFFEKQADKYGFNKIEYIEALRKVPVLSHHKVTALIAFYKQLAQMITNLGYHTLLLKRERLNENININRALQESEAKFRLLIQVLGEGVAIVDQNEEFILANTAAEEIFGVGSNELIGRNLIDFLSEAGKQMVKNETQKRLKGIKSTYELEIITEKKEIKHLLVTATPYMSSQNIFQGIIGVFRDITERKMMERQLISLNADKDRFMQILAHDLRNPFTTLMAYSDLLQKNIRNYDVEKIEKQLFFINQTTKNTYNLLEDLLLWSKSQAGKLPFEPAKLYLKDICSEIIYEMQNMTLSKNIKLSVNISDTIIVFADKNMLKTILRNLLSNAIKFTNRNGSVSIIAEYQQNITIVTVSDNGIGISADVINKLWNFAKPYTTEGTENESGTGLGLALCKEFVEKHGGTIHVESEPGKGSDFIFSLTSF